MGVEMDRNTNLRADRLDKDMGRVGLTQPCHVLDGQDVGSHIHEGLREVGVVGEAVLGPPWIADVAGIADRRFTQRRRLATHGLHRHPHRPGIIESIEDPKQVDTVVRALDDERFDDVVWVVGVANGIAAAHEHLKKDVRNPLAQPDEPSPWVLLEKPHRGVKRGTAPHLQAEDVW